MNQVSIRQALNEGETRIRAIGSDSPRLDAELLLAEATGKDRLYLFVHSNEFLSVESLNLYRDFLDRRSNSEPVSHILGKVEFYDRKFIVNNHVLAPRPETEDLIQWILDHANKENARVLDLGCGTGCIGITLACERKLWKVDMVDISEPALQVARRNYESLCNEGTRVNFYKSDFFIAIPSRKYDIIASNPPYIFPDEKKDLMKDVIDFEPEVALIHPDPEALYSHLIEQSSKWLASDGIAIFELSPRLSRHAFDTASRYFHNVWSIKDCFNQTRFTAMSSPL